MKIQSGLYTNYPQYSNSNKKSSKTGFNGELVVFQYGRKATMEILPKGLNELFNKPNIQMAIKNAWCNINLNMQTNNFFSVSNSLAKSVDLYAFGSPRSLWQNEFDDETVEEIFEVINQFCKYKISP